MKNRIKILLIGPGLIGSKHAKLIFESDKLQLEAIVTPNINKYTDFGIKYNVSMFTDLETALAEKQIDGVVISSPNKFHYEQAKLCLEKGIPTLVEKPLTSNLTDAKTLVDLSEKKEIPLLVADHRLYNPLLYIAKDFVNSEEFGELVSYAGSAQFYKPKHYFEDAPWRSKIGGGPILINLIHEIGIMRAICGEISKVSAFSSNKIRGFEVEDTVSVNIEFLNGALGTFMLSDTAASNKSWEMTTGENPAYPHYPEDIAYHIAGTKGSIDFPSMKIRTYKDRESSSWWKPFNDSELDKKYEDPLKIQIEHFGDVISGNVEPISTARNGYMNMLVVEAVKKSLEEERCVNLFA
ncbi:MAG: Gfo/Idh/MocA family oxidoreductase [Campylobacterales bacterium]|nr:Gfo/Idh/MocA family oxidoreductase [Campylobacterales bacterium]